ncbi:hypothetical protein DFH07DRAFT_772835 [Mycena maculata]|uniref:Uncharacterized protein n=1 Tax=Mycena maculata TaxID=230809 RepID=A0AAD7J5R8_9AGAR|nr:hypothetical protein DFH07DRAFT_772835 [Mycena maculata]
MTFESIPLSIAVGVVSGFPALHTLRFSGTEVARDVIPPPQPLSIHTHTLEFGARGEGFVSDVLSLPDPPLPRNVELYVARFNTCPSSKLDQCAINLQDLNLVVLLLDFVAAVSSPKLTKFHIYQVLWSEEEMPNPWGEIYAVLTADS